MSESQHAYLRKVPNNNNPNAMLMDFPPGYDRADTVRFAISCNHDDEGALPGVIPERPIHLPVTLNGVVP